MKLKLIILIVLNLIVLTACMTNYTSTIDWVDFIILSDIHFNGDGQHSKTLDEEDIGQQIGEVKFKVDGNIRSSSYKVKNGDAAFLEKGTKIYSIKGFKPSFRIAAKVNGVWRLYEADTNPNATKGEDLLDIGGKVMYIGINSETDGITELYAIKDQESVEKLVSMVLNAEVNQKLNKHDGQRYFIAFHLNDGSSLSRCYWIETGELSRGIKLPKEFAAEISKALGK